MEGDKLKDKIAIVTGASSGIGRATAIYLANNGAKVGLLARRLERLKELQEDIESRGGKALAVKCDVSNRQQVFDAVESVRTTFGTIDILVNNAGVSNFSMTYNCNLDAWLEVIDVNIIGTLHCYAAVLPDMMDRKSGHIINISSVLGRTAMQMGAPYQGSKFFMQGHSAGMRLELASQGIKVTVIQPGLVKTEANIGQEPDVLKFASKTLPFCDMANREMLESEDVAESVVFALTQHDRVGVNEIMMEAKNAITNDK